MDVLSELREGMAVLDPAGRQIGDVEDLINGHFFLAYTPRLPLVKERIAVDAATSVARVDAQGVHLRHDRQELLMLDVRPLESLSFRGLAPDENPDEVHRGDEDRAEAGSTAEPEQRTHTEGSAGAQAR